jgi:hypothetical protein
MTTTEQFVAMASPIDYGYMIKVWRDPHPQGHVPVSLADLRTGTQWSPDAASELLLSRYGYETAPGSHWQPLSDDGRYGIRLCRATGGEAR